MVEEDYGCPDLSLEESLINLAKGSIIEDGCKRVNLDEYGRRYHNFEGYYSRGDKLIRNDDGSDRLQ